MDAHASKSYPYTDAESAWSGLPSTARSSSDSDNTFSSYRYPYKNSTYIQRLSQTRWRPVRLLLILLTLILLFNYRSKIWPDEEDILGSIFSNSGARKLKYGQGIDNTTLGFGKVIALAPAEKDGSLAPLFRAGLATGVNIDVLEGPADSSEDIEKNGASIERAQIQTHVAAWKQYVFSPTFPKGPNGFIVPTCILKYP